MYLLSWTERGLQQHSGGEALDVFLALVWRGDDEKRRKIDVIQAGLQNTL